MAVIIYIRKSFKKLTRDVNVIKLQGSSSLLKRPQKLEYLTPIDHRQLDHRQLETIEN